MTSSEQNLESALHVRHKNLYIDDFDKWYTIQPTCTPNIMSVETHHHSFIFEAEFQVQVANLRTHNDEVTML